MKIQQSPSPQSFYFISIVLQQQFQSFYYFCCKLLTAYDCQVISIKIIIIQFFISIYFFISAMNKSVQMANKQRDRILSCGTPFLKEFFNSIIVKVQLLINPLRIQFLNCKVQLSLIYTDIIDLNQRYCMSIQNQQYYHRLLILNYLLIISKSEIKFQIL
ncbi:unnamed protein product (macronuclear) [Paramecium tetraurelia]|uniref:Transmembrane protein n=1 Tax=Paramecium tetraurelia TaxID=5888 RepID=A0EAA8_PARTE|nr:uncharacterized protein GSPATT00024957001 [Paramecium tetraurelia]CAK92225.1 unnamed protein product [Paramecium tetraurelia]|eukprot:XP_001459622.1 hypothetical protein (macronuclear) [Paramecium tetraurelia strain d4-2]